MFGHNQAALNLKFVFFGWLAPSATSIGLVSPRYALLVIPFPAEIPKVQLRHGWIIAHAVLSSVALLVGPWQFLNSLRRRWLLVHRVDRKDLLRYGYCGVAVVVADSSTRSCWRGLLSGVLDAWLSLDKLQDGWVLRNSFRPRGSASSLDDQELCAAMCSYYSLYLYSIDLSDGVLICCRYRIIACVCLVPNLILAEWLLRGPGTIFRSRVVQTG